MLITEKIKINDHDYIHNYSDAGFYIKRDEILYADAIDPANLITERIYEETDIKIEDNPDEKTELEIYAEAGKILLGEEV